MGDDVNKPIASLQYTYEKVINGQNTNYSYDKGNQLASSTVNGIRTDYNYDAAGRMSSETTAGVTKSYTYGWLDKVVKVQAGESVMTFSYYADGQLAQKKSGETVENFYWDELALLRRGDTNYINDPAVTGGNPILADNTILFTDMLGNTLGSVENEVFQPIGRTAFGETNSKLASANLDFFTGKPQVEGLGYNFLLRNYNAQVGKWQTQDPLGYPDGWNNFAYCNSDVLNAVDAMGGATLVALSNNVITNTKIDDHKRTYLPDGTIVFLEKSSIEGKISQSKSENDCTLIIDFLGTFNLVDKANNINYTINLKYSILFYVDDNEQVFSILIGDRTNKENNGMEISGKEKLTSQGKIYTVSLELTGTFSKNTSWGFKSISCSVEFFKFKVE